MILENLVKDLPGDPSLESFPIKDINPLGGTTKLRIIRKPNKPMQILHQCLIKYLRKSLHLKMPFATGGMPGNSPVKNLEQHRKNRFFYLVDLKNAFPNVNDEKLATILCSLDPQLTEKKKEVLNFLKKYCLAPKGGLIIGVNASPDLFNIYCAVLLDPLLGHFCRWHGLTFTRYLDDLAFSSPKIPIGKRKRRKIREIITRTEFSVNHHKCKVLDLRKGPIAINGVGLDLGGRIFLPRHFARKINGMLYRAIMHGDINPNKINGVMGVFFALTDRRKLNVTEEKILQKYRIYRRLIQRDAKANKQS